MQTLQNILVIIAAIFAVWVLYAKFLKKKKTSGNCGSDDCGC